MNIDVIFIVGCQRAGTTMLAEQLGRFDGCVATPEFPFVKELCNLALAGWCKEEAFKIVCGSPRYKQLFKEPLKGDMSSVADVLLSLIKMYLEKFSVEFKNFERVTWVCHCPEFVADIELFSDSFPGAKFVHLTRDPRALYYSFKRVRWGPASVVEMSQYWNSITAKSLYYSSNFSSHHLVVYEEFLLNHSFEFGRLTEFLNLKSGKSSSSTLQLPSFTKRQHSDVGASLNLSSLTKWRDTLSIREANFIHSECFDFMKILGYENQLPAGCFSYSPFIRLALELRSICKRSISFISRKYIRRYD